MTKASDIAGELNKRLKKSTKTIDVSLLSSDNSPCVVSEWIPTGALALDSIMGQGLPVGRIVEIYGSPSSGKSLIAAQIAAVAQQAGYTVAYIDTESAVSINMMRKLGVNVDDLIYTSPDTVEEVFTFMEEAIETKHKIDPDGVLVLIWDSIAATSSVAEMEKDFGNTGYLTQARVISQALRKITKLFSKERVAVLFLNQTRQKIGVMFGDKTATFGGDAVAFHASVRISLSTGVKLKAPGKKKAKIVGMVTRAVCVKNKVAFPFREVELPIYFGRAIDDAQASFLWLVDNGYVTNAGSWFTIEFTEETVKFQKKEWQSIFDQHYDAIADIILSSNNDENDDGEVGEEAYEEE